VVLLLATWFEAVLVTLTEMSLAYIDAAGMTSMESANVENYT
jgi:hypothetical protein